MPAVKACKAYKFASPFHGPYCIVELSKTGIAVCPVDYNRVQQCSGFNPNKFLANWN